MVPIKEGNVHPYMTIDEITQGGRRNHCILMDNNILASDFGLQQLVEISDKGYRIDLNQANDARMVTHEIAELFASINWIESTVRFAADTDKQINDVFKSIDCIDSYRIQKCKNKLKYIIYTMIHGDIKDCYYRINRFKGFKNIRICAQPFRDPNGKNLIPQWQNDMARWANRKEFFTSCSFLDFRPRKGFTCREYFNNI